jgi:hypothetical protein
MVARLDLQGLSAAMSTASGGWCARAWKGVQGLRRGYQSEMLERRTGVEKRGPCSAGMVGNSSQGVSLVLVEESSSARLRQWGERSSSVKVPNVIEKVRKC